MFHFSKTSIRVNEEQAQAIRRPPGVHQRILASAGSGKTTTLHRASGLPHRVMWRQGREHCSDDFFTKCRTADEGANGELIGPQKMWAGTFHGLSRALLKKFSSEALKALYFVDELVNMGETWLSTTDGRKWVGGLRYIVVDEFQDINEEQWKMLQRMLHPGAHLIIVGDDCQNIIRGAGAMSNTSWNFIPR
jgi:superfamily I DNA/RNA helicase